MSDLDIRTPVGERTLAVAGDDVGLWHGLSAVAAGQLSRVKVARIPLLLVASMQSIGIEVLLRGAIGPGHRGDAVSIVAGSVVLVAAFVSLNLLAQRFGALRAARALDYYAALPVSPAAVVLGTVAAYATFAIPGALVTGIAGALGFGLPLLPCLLIVPAIVIAAICLAGVGASLGLLMPRQELATVSGQLGMTLALFLGVIPPAHLPVVIRGLRLAVPGMLCVDALADGWRTNIAWLDLLVRLGVSVIYAGAALGLAHRCWCRAVRA